MTSAAISYNIETCKRNAKCYLYMHRYFGGSFNLLFAIRETQRALKLHKMLRS
jgi:hypothetical protein